MAIGPTLAITGATCVRYLVSHANKLSVGKGLLYNATDMAVSLVVCKCLTDKIKTSMPITQNLLGIILVSRVISVIVGIAVTAPFGQIDLLTAIALNSTSLIASVFIRIAVENAAPPPAETPDQIPPSLPRVYGKFSDLAADIGKVLQGILYA